MLVLLGCRKPRLPVPVEKTEEIFSFKYHEKEISQLPRNGLVPWLGGESRGSFRSQDI